MSASRWGWVAIASRHASSTCPVTAPSNFVQARQACALASEINLLPLPKFVRKAGLKSPVWRWTAVDEPGSGTLRCMITGAGQGEVAG